MKKKIKVLAIAFLMGSTASFAQFSVSSGGSNLTALPYDRVGIGVNDPGILQNLHLKDVFTTSVPGGTPYSGLTLGIRFENVLTDGMVSSTRTFDLASAGGNFQVYNVTNDRHDLTIRHNNGYMGIGTDAPQGRLDVVSGNSATDAMYVRASPGTADQGGLIHHQSSTYAWQTVAQGTGSGTNATLQYHFVNRADPSVKVKANVLSLHASGRVGIGVESPAHELDVCGTARAKEVIVEAGWCDYVFDEGYQIMSLGDLQAYIDDNHHLPNIPSAKTVEEEGLKVADMVPRMMEKIEELTLYILAQEQRIAELEAQAAQ